MEKQIYREIEEIVKTSELSEIRIICEHCDNYYVKFKRSHVSEFPSFIKIVVTSPHPTKKWQTIEETKHYCPDCWSKIEKLL